SRPGPAGAHAGTTASSGLGVTRRGRGGGGRGGRRSGAARRDLSTSRSNDCWILRSSRTRAAPCGPYLSRCARLTAAPRRRRTPDALALAGGERHPASADPCPVARGQPQDHVVGTGDPPRRKDLLRCRGLVEACDVLRDAAVEQGHILRQITDVPPKLVAMPLVERGAVEPYHAVRGRPHADQRLRQRRLS